MLTCPFCVTRCINLLRIKKDNVPKVPDSFGYIYYLLSLPGSEPPSRAHAL